PDSGSSSLSSPAMGTRFLLVLCLVLLVLSCEIQGAQLLPQDEPASPPLLAQVKESLSSYWDTAKAAARGLYQKTYLNNMDEKIRDLYSKGSEAMSTYAGVFTDQLLTLLKGE
ncbi:hypothetical protein PSU14_21305, partial [Yersinia pestis]|nr:hypothetical protein [Yersinia pestis]